MRILFLTHRLPYAPNRGDRIRAFHLLEAMSRLGRVSLFSLLGDDDASKLADVPFADHVTGVRVTPARNRISGAIRLATQRPLTHSLLSAPSIREKLDALVRSAPPDLVVAYCSSMARFAMESPLDRFPFVLDMVDVDSRKWQEQAERSHGLLKLVYAREAKTLRAFERAAVSRAKVTLVVNDRERDVLMDMASRRTIHVLPNGIDVAAFASPGLPETTPTVVFCGVMDYAPNVEGVLWFVDRVWPQIIAARPDARFLIVGASPTGAIRRLTDRFPSVQVTGAVPMTQEYLWKSAVSVAPLRLARGLQNKVLESLAAGLPVVITSAVCEGLPVSARRGCSVANEESAFAAEVITLLATPADQRRAKADSARLEELSWTRAMADLPMILTSAVDCRSTTSSPIGTTAYAR